MQNTQSGYGGLHGCVSEHVQHHKLYSCARFHAFNSHLAHITWTMSVLREKSVKRDAFLIRCKFSTESLTAASLLKGQPMFSHVKMDRSDLTKATFFKLYPGTA